MVPKGGQKGANRRKSCSKIMPRSVRSFSFCYIKFYSKNGHGALVGLTKVKGTSVDKFFQFFEKNNWKTWFLELVGLTLVKGRSVRKQVTKKERKWTVPSAYFWKPVWCQIVKNQFKKSSNKDHPKIWNLMPKGSQNGAEINIKTYQKAMQKQVTKKIMKIIKNHVSLKGKIIQIHCKNICF